MALGLEASGVDAEKVESLTPNAGDEEFGIADLLGVMSAGVDDFEGRPGDFEREELLLKTGGGRCASKFGLRDGMRARGDGGREDRSACGVHASLLCVRLCTYHAGAGGLRFSRIL